MLAKPDSSRGLPTWLSAIILLMLVAGGGWGVWRYFEGGSGELSAADAAQLTDANVDGPPMPRERRPGQRPPNFGQFAARIAANMPDGIMPAGNAYLVKAGTVRLDIDAPAGNNNRGDWRYRFSYAIPDLPSAEQVQVLRAGRRAVNDPAAAQKLGITAQQLDKLRGVPGGTMMVIDAPDRIKMSKLFHNWLIASGRSTATTKPALLPAPTAESKAAEQELLTTLGDIGKQQLEPTRQAYTARVQQIQTILGAELLQKLKPAG